jgi:hypothetical protein
MVRRASFEVPSRRGFIGLDKIGQGINLVTLPAVPYYCMSVVVNTCVLHHIISVVRIVTDPDGTTRVGVLTQLPRDTTVEICGSGFDDRTVKVRTGDSLFYAFRADLQVNNDSRETR